MPRRRKTLESPAAEPQPVAAVLATSPIAQILASHDARAEIEPDQPMPEPTHVERLARPTPGMQPVPKGFRNVSSYPDAGMRVNRSDDRSIAAIQFAEDRKASRNGLRSEIDTMEIRGFRYEPQPRQ